MFPEKILGMFPEKILGMFPEKILGKFPEKILGMFPMKFLGMFPVIILGRFPKVRLGIFPKPIPTGIPEKTLLRIPKRISVLDRVTLERVNWKITLMNMKMKILLHVIHNKRSERALSQYLPIKKHWKSL
jgi:hypothetical protein